MLTNMTIWNGRKIKLEVEKW